MPMFNPETKRHSAQWKHINSPPPKKFRVTASAEKMMAAMFWDSEGAILTHCFPKSRAVTGETYEDVLRSFFQHYVKNVPKRLQLCPFNIDNAPPYRAARVHQVFVDNNFEVVPHAPYSPDLAPSDFWLFSTLKDPFVVARFQVVSLLQQRFSSGHNEPLKKRLLRPSNRGVNDVKNVYVYRVITSRNDSIFSFLG